MFWLWVVLGLFILIVLLIGSHLRHQDIIYNQQKIINLLGDISTEIRGLDSQIDSINSSALNDIDSLRKEFKENNSEFISIIKDILGEIQDVNRRIR